MPVFPSNKDEVLSRYIENLTSRTPINQVIPGSKARSIGETFAREIELMFQLEESNFEKSFLSTSYGQFLVRHAAETGVRRRPSRNAQILASDRVIRFYVENDQTFGSINNNESFTISAGSILTAPSEIAVESAAMFLGVDEPNTPEDRSIHYTVTEDVICLPNEKEAFVSAKCMVEGTQGNITTPNMLVRHLFTDYAEYQRNKLKVTNVKPILTGADKESDNSLKYRTSKIVTSAEGSNEDSIREKVLKIPGVVDYVLLPFQDGVGRYNLYIKSITSTVSDRMIEEVQTVLDTINAVGVIGFARRPMEIGLEIKTNLVYDKKYKEEEKALIRQNLIYAATTYINSLDIGQSLALPALAEELKSIDRRVSAVGSNLKTAFDNVFIHIPARLTNSGKRREKLIQPSIQALPHARIIVETNVSNAIQLV